MKTYQANSELEQILLTKGFIETTSQRDKLKGKKSFKLSENSKKEIYFDYINITIINRHRIEDSRINLKESELKVILLFFLLDKTDFKELSAENKFNINEIANKLNSIESEHKRLVEHNMNTKRQIKLKRILDTYKNIYI